MLIFPVSSVKISNVLNFQPKRSYTYTAILY